MSVYTHLTLAEIQPLLQHLAQPKAVSLTPIKGGIENSNYFVRLENDQECVLTLFEELNAEQAAFLGPLLMQLQSAGIPVAAPFADQQGQWLHRLANKPAQLAKRMPGQHALQPTVAQCRAMGAALARLHLAIQSYPLQRAHAHGADWWHAVADSWRTRLPAADAHLLDEVLLAYASVTAHTTLASGLIHGDLFRDNVLFDGDTVSAILDFSECSHDHWLLDIAITANDFCRQWPREIPDDERLAALLAGYQSQRALSPDEAKALPVFLAVAALRFWLSRLEVAERNRLEQRVGAHVLQKDPNEMRDLLQWRMRQLENH